MRADLLVEIEDYLRHCANSPILADRLKAELAKPDATFTNDGSKPWIGLTDAEIYKIVDDRTPVFATLEELTDFALTVRNTESKLKEKNA